MRHDRHPLELTGEHPPKAAVGLWIADQRESHCQVPHARAPLVVAVHPKGPDEASLVHQSLMPCGILEAHLVAGQAVFVMEGLEEQCDISVYQSHRVLEVHVCLVELCLVDASRPCGLSEDLPVVAGHVLRRKLMSEVRHHQDEGVVAQVVHDGRGHPGRSIVRMHGNRLLRLRPMRMRCEGRRVGRVGVAAKHGQFVHLHRRGRRRVVPPCHCVETAASLLRPRSRSTSSSLLRSRSVVLV